MENRDPFKVGIFPTKGDLILRVSKILGCLSIWGRYGSVVGFRACYARYFLIWVIVRFTQGHVGPIGFSSVGLRSSIASKVSIGQCRGCTHCSLERERRPSLEGSIRPCGVDGSIESSAYIGINFFKNVPISLHFLASRV